MAQLGAEINEFFSRLESEERAQSRARAQSDRKIGQLTSELEALRREVTLFRAGDRASQEEARSLAEQLSQARYTAELKSKLLEEERQAQVVRSEQWAAE